ncbi:MAG: hypothetical protein HKP38_00380 [Croceitalea sp.]|nr:hypothetical protein [Croceitalea sp.]MBT8239146.1 hypothetical protein [Croceitalea sp.]NNC34048.1 hypothetical protein [Croceitalea sp.]NNL07657.1 hypothetical protein [Croceitalea sp.]NNM16937.1 hypothetical protein [Croceitalea sp.]
MKNLSKSLAALCLAGILFAPSAQAQSNVLELKGITVRPLNISYLRNVMDHRMPELVTALENKAARFNIFESPVYDGKFDAYEVMFTQEKGTIIATYNKDGKIMQSTERFKDFTLPDFIRNEIYQEHPGWTIHSDAYLVSYFYDKEVKKVCRVQLRKDGQRKNIKILI